MTIHIRTGLPGAAKTLLTIEDVEKLRNQSGREVYYYGISELKLPWIKLEDATKWNDLPPNSIIVIDEAQKVFRPRGSGAAVPPHVEHLETHRHKGYDFYLITQHPMLLDGNVRRLAGRHEHVVRIFGKEKSNVHRWDSVKEQCDKSRADSIKTERAFPKELYGVYHSADAHNIKKAVPLRMYLLLFIPVIIVLLLTFAGWTMWKASHNDIGSEEKEQMGLVGAFKPESSAVGGKQGKPELTWIEARQERVPGIPYSAPVYDKITEPVTAPVIAACVDFRGQCKCYSQQATPIQVDENMCKQIIRSGVFVDFDPGQSANERIRQEERERILAEREKSEQNRQRMLDRQRDDRDEEKQKTASPAQESQPSGIQPSVIQRQRMQESPWAFNQSQS